MKKTLFAVILLMFTANVRADLIFEIHNTDTYYSANIMSFGLWYSDHVPHPDPIPETVLNWDNIYIPNRMNTEIFITADDDPHFGLFVEYLSNGVNDIFRYMYSLPNSNYGLQVYGDMEQSYFKDSPYCTNGIDFEGTEFEKFSLTVLDENNHVFRFYGNAVPEPTSIALMILGSTAFLRRKSS